MNKDAVAEWIVASNEAMATLSENTTGLLKDNVKQDVSIAVLMAVSGRVLAHIAEKSGDASSFIDSMIAPTERAAEQIEGRQELKDHIREAISQLRSEANAWLGIP